MWNVEDDMLVASRRELRGEIAHLQTEKTRVEGPTEPTECARHRGEALSECGFETLHVFIVGRQI